VIQGENPFRYFQLWTYAVWFLFDITLIFKFISSYGLFRFRKWGRTVTVCALFSDFLLRLGGVINAWTYDLRHPELYAKLQSNPPLPEYAITYSMIPSYVIALLSLISAIILLSKPVEEFFYQIHIKKLLQRKHNNAHEPDGPIKRPSGYEQR
jgi:hypothetical protein